MICIIKLKNPNSGPYDPTDKRFADSIAGYIVATDTHDARRRAYGAGDNELATMMYRIEFPKNGVHRLSDDYIMIVDN